MMLTHPRASTKRILLEPVQQNLRRAQFDIARYAMPDFMQR